MYNGANIEMDFYGGWKTTLRRLRPRPRRASTTTTPVRATSRARRKIDNTELYIGGSWGPISLKYNYAVSDFFGVPDSKGAYYLLLSGVYDFGNGFGINGSVGYQAGLKNGACVTEIDGQRACSITDYKLGGTYTIDGWVLGLAYVSTNRDLTAGTAAYSNRTSATAPALVSVTKSF